MHGCGQLIAAVDLCPAVGIVHQHLAVRVGIVGSGDHTGSAQIAQGDVVGADKAQRIGVGQAGTQEAGQKAQLLIAPCVAADVVTLHHSVQDHKLLLRIVGGHIFQAGALAAAQTDDEVAVSTVGIAGYQTLVLGVILGLGIYPLDAHGALRFLHAVIQRVVKGLVSQAAGGEHNGDLGAFLGIVTCRILVGLPAGHQGQHRADHQQHGQPLFHICKLHLSSSLHGSF